MGKRERVSRPRHPADRRRRITLRGSDAEVLAAREALDRITADLRRGLLTNREAIVRVERLVGIVRPSVTFGELWRKFRPTLPGQRRELYDTRWRCHLEGTFGVMLVEGASRERCEAWQKERLRTVAWNTMRGAWIVLSRMTRWAVEQGYIDRVPWSGFAVGEDPKGDGLWRGGYCSDVRQVCRLLVAALRRDVEHVRRCGYSDITARIALCLFSGARRSEGAALRWDHVFLDRSPAAVSLSYATKVGWADRVAAPFTTEHTKGKHGDLVAIPEILTGVLRAHRELQVRAGLWREGGAVFPRPLDGKARRDPDLIDSVILRRCVRDAGLGEPERWTSHSLRHSFASLEGAGGATLRELQIRLRVRTPSVVLRYYHGRGAEVQQPVFSRVDEALGLAAHEAPEHPEPGALAAVASAIETHYRAAIEAARPTGRIAELAEHAGGEFRRVAGLLGTGADPARPPYQIRERIRATGERARRKALRAGASPEEATRAARTARARARAAWAAQVAREVSDANETGGRPVCRA